MRIKLRPVLKALGRAALLNQGEGRPSYSDYTVLGIESLPEAGDDRGAGIDAVRLAAQLSVFALAARQCDDQGVLASLREAVGELVPAHADTAAWLDVLTVAEPVVAAMPQLAGDLRDTLISRWPPAAASRPWDHDPVLRYRFDIETLLKQVRAIGEQVGRTDVNRAVSWMLECAWLSQPILRTASIEFAGQAIRSLLRTRLRSAAQTWDDVLSERQQVLESVLRWGRDRCAGPPTKLPDTEQNLRDPAVAAHVLLTALTPLLSVIAEEHGFGMPEAAKVFVWSHHVLPDDRRTTDIVMSAADAVGSLLSQLDPEPPAVKPVLHAIVRLPQQLRSESARGLAAGKPLPAYAAEIMDKAALRVGQSIASSWPVLPLSVRYAAAESTVRHGGRRGRPLADLAADGDPIATAAAADSTLDQMLTVLPIDQPRFRQPAGSDRGKEEETLRRRAQDLAGQLSTSEAIELLTLADPATASSYQYDCLAAFALTVGQNAAEPQPVLDRLAEGAITADVYLFSGLLQTWPDESVAWLSQNTRAGHPAARLALWVADDLPADQEAALLDAIIAQLGTDCSNARTAGTGVKLASGDSASHPDDTDAEGPDQLALTTQAADHLGRCRMMPADRLARLIALGSTAPDHALPRILGAVDRVIRTLPEMGALTGDENGALRHGLACLLTRVLASADGALGADIDYDTATAAEAFGRAAPTETAQILADRVLSATLPAIPYRWKDMLAQAPPSQREPLAAAYYDRIEPYLAARMLPAEAEAAALDVLAVLGRGTSLWAGLLRGWSAGGAAYRARTASAIRQCWHDPIWRELVPDLLDTGLSEESATELRLGLLPMDDVTDAAGIGRRLGALQPLRIDTRPVVRQWADDAAQGLYALMSLLQGRRT